MTFEEDNKSACNSKYRLILIANSYQPLIFGDFKQKMVKKLYDFGECNGIEVLSVEIIDNAVMDILFSTNTTKDINDFLETYRATINDLSNEEHVDLNGYSFWNKQTLLINVGEESTPKDDERVIDFIKREGKRFVKNE